MGSGRSLLLLALASCYQPAPSVGAPCDTDTACPRGQACVAGFCGTGSATVDAPAVPGDAALDAAIDAPADAPPGSWGAPVPVPGVNTTATEGDPSMSADRRLIVFARGGDLYLGARTAVTAAFAVVELTALDGGFEASPELSPDGSTLYFTSDRITPDDRDVYVSVLTGGEFGPPARVAELSTTGNEGDVAIAPDGLTAIVSRDSEFYRATRATANDAWSTPVALGINFGTGEAAPSLTSAGDLYFHAGSTRDLFVARATGDTFAAPVPIAELNTSGRDAAPFVSGDERSLCYERDGELVESRR